MSEFDTIADQDWPEYLTAPAVPGKGHWPGSAGRSQQKSDCADSAWFNSGLD